MKSRLIHAIIALFGRNKPNIGRFVISQNKSLKQEKKDIRARIEKHKVSAGKLKDWLEQNRILEQLQFTFAGDSQ